MTVFELKFSIGTASGYFESKHVAIITYQLFLLLTIRGTIALINSLQRFDIISIISQYTIYTYLLSLDSISAKRSSLILCPESYICQDVEKHHYFKDSIFLIYKFLVRIIEYDFSPLVLNSKYLLTYL